jgi:hypothetical protein
MIMATFQNKEWMIEKLKYIYRGDNPHFQNELRRKKHQSERN